MSSNSWAVLLMLFFMFRFSVSRLLIRSFCLFSFSDRFRNLFFKIIFSAF
ncbi:hypothetical protein 2011_scaffold13_00060 [Bacteriophage sp.]|nr:hypothetical protein 2011_scaffold13_00060 [Bacteriophage sp.]